MPSASERGMKYLYVLDRGMIFTSNGIRTDSAPPCYATIMLSTCGAPFQITVAKKTGIYQAAMIAPGVRRELYVRSARFIQIFISPAHRLFSAFCRPNVAPILRLDKNYFSALIPALSHIYDGDLDFEAAGNLHDAVIETASHSLDDAVVAKAFDAKVGKVLLALERVDTPNLQQLSSSIGLSYHRMSHRFAESVGIPMRSYCLWRKLHKVPALIKPGVSLTQIAHLAGFTDSAHMSNTFQQMYGAPPSYFINNAKVKMLNAHQASNSPAGPAANGLISSAIG